MSDSGSLSYCAEQVRQHDPDRFVMALFAPAGRREALFALYAFNLELAKAREVVSEPMMGRIRLQWWRDGLDGIAAGKPPGHRVAEALAAAVTAYGLPVTEMGRMIDTREADMEDAPHGDMAALLAYADGTTGSLGALAAAVLGGAPDNATADAVRQAGVAHSLTGLLRAVPFHARGKRLYLPQDRVAAAGVGLGDLFELRGSAALNTVVAEVADAADMALSAARSVRGTLPRVLRHALLPAALAAGDRARLRRAGHDPFDVRLRRDPLRRVFRLGFAALSGRY